jgi:hypothetical protein
MRPHKGWWLAVQHTDSTSFPLEWPEHEDSYVMSARGARMICIRVGYGGGCQEGVGKPLPPTSWCARAWSDACQGRAAAVVAVGPVPSTVISVGTWEISRCLHQIFGGEWSLFFFFPSMFSNCSANLLSQVHLVCSSSLVWIMWMSNTLCCVGPWRSVFLFCINKSFIKDGRRIGRLGVLSVVAVSMHRWGYLSILDVGKFNPSNFLMIFHLCHH